jgi:hypothetical protein
MAGEEARLQPLIQSAFGQGVQGLDTTNIQETFTKDIAEKKEQYKTALEIGDDLKFEFRGQIEGQIEDILDKASKGDIKVGSSDWLRATDSLERNAINFKQTQDLGDEISAALRDKPDSTSVLIEVDGKMVDVGLSGFLAEQKKALAEGLAEGGSPDKVMNNLANLAQKVQYHEVGVSEGMENARTTASEVSKMLMGGVGDPENRAVTYSSPKLGNIEMLITTNLPQEDVDIAVATLGDQFGDVIGRSYDKIPISERGEETKEKYVARVLEGMLNKKVVKAANLTDKNSTKTDKSSLTNAQLIRAKNIKPTVNKAQKTQNPIILNEYFRGNGYEVVEGENGLWDVIVRGKAIGEESRIVDSFNPAQAEEIYNAIANWGKIKREMIDAFDYVDENPMTETPTEREINAKVKAEGEQMDKILDSILEINPDDKTIAPASQTESQKSNIAVQKEYLDDIKGVSYEIASNKWGITDYIRYITIGGKKFDMSKQGEEAKVAMQNQIKQNAEVPEESKQEGVGSRYNKP